MIGSLILEAAWGPLIGLGVPWLRSWRSGRPGRPLYLLWMCYEVGNVVIDLLPPGNWPFLVIDLSSGAVAAWLWWRSRRRKGKRAPRALGAKSRARLAQLVQGLRDALRPRRVWQPQPGGAW